MTTLATWLFPSANVSDSEMSRVTSTNPELPPTAGNLRDGESNARPIRVLFLCTHNSARSQLAEAILRLRGGVAYDVHSAGSLPAGVHPMALSMLEEHGIDVSAHHSKSMDVYAGQSFDYVISLCDGVRDLCPHFPNDPVHIHWSFPNPAAVEDEETRRRAFSTLWLELNTRIGTLLNMPHPVSGRRIGPAALAGMQEVQDVPDAQRPGLTGRLAGVTQKLHLHHVR